MNGVADFACAVDMADVWMKFLNLFYVSVYALHGISKTYTFCVFASSFASPNTDDSTPPWMQEGDNGYGPIWRMVIG